MLTHHLESLFTTRQLAKYLGLKEQTLRKWRLSGDGPQYVRLGDGPRARVVYRMADIQKWLDARSYQSTSEESVARVVGRASTLD